MHFSTSPTHPERNATNKTAYAYQMPRCRRQQEGQTTCSSSAPSPSSCRVTCNHLGRKPPQDEEEAQLASMDEQAQQRERDDERMADERDQQVGSKDTPPPPHGDGVPQPHRPQFTLKGLRPK